MPVETFDRLRALGDRALFLSGNAERELAEGTAPEEELGHARFEWLSEQLGPERLEFMRSLPANVRVVVDGVGPTLFCHGSPRSDLEVLTPDTPDDRLREALATADANVVVCGHTHSQWIRELDGITVANAGSVGLPYEDRPGAYWALVAHGVHHRRTDVRRRRRGERLRGDRLPGGGRVRTGDAARAGEPAGGGGVLRAARPRTAGVRRPWRVATSARHAGPSAAAATGSGRSSTGSQPRTRTRRSRSASAHRSSCSCR